MKKRLVCEELTSPRAKEKRERERVLPPISWGPSSPNILSLASLFSLNPIAMAPSVPPPVSPFRPDLLLGKVREKLETVERSRKRKTRKTRCFFDVLIVMLSFSLSLSL
jgi:hypothetical protein